MNELWSVGLLVVALLCWGAVALLVWLDLRRFRPGRGCPPCSGDCNQGRDCPGRK